jgi:hypothetical protein
MYILMYIIRIVFNEGLLSESLLVYVSVCMYMFV